MSESQFPALSLDNNPWMKYFSPSAGHHDVGDKSRVASAATTERAPTTASPLPQVFRSSSGRLTRHTSAPNRLSTPPPSPDRNSGDNRRSKAEAPSADSAPPPPQPKLVKKASNPLLAKQKLFKSTQSAPNLTAAMRELAVTDIAGRSIESELSQQSLYKTELCRSYEDTGVCRYGAKCQFAHGKSELRPIVRHPKYKTEICKTWQAHGSCPYGARCRFIHHAEELAPATTVHATSAGPTATVDDPERTPVAPSASSATPAPRLAVFADIIGKESTAQ